MLLTVELTDIDLIFCVTLTDVNFQNIFVMVTVALKQTYLCLSWKKLQDLNIYKNTKKINGLCLWILLILIVWICTSQTVNYYMCHCLNKFGVCVSLQNSCLFSLDSRFFQLDIFVLIWYCCMPDCLIFQCLVAWLFF